MANGSAIERPVTDGKKCVIDKTQLKTLKGKESVAVADIDEWSNNPYNNC